MNWLAHLVLSERSIDYQLGNLLADPLKGKFWEGANASIRDGFAMHREIDGFTDSNSIVSKSKSRLGKKGYLKGVVIDVVYDHLLTKTWDIHCKVRKDEFIGEFNENALGTIKAYPDRPREFVSRLIRSGHLSSYSDLEGVNIALKRIDRRLSRNLLAKESASGYMPIIKREIADLENDFNAFFPVLVSHFKAKSEFKGNDHWLR